LKINDNLKDFNFIIINYEFIDLFFFFLNSNKRSNQTLSLLFVHWKIYNYNL
jgi:hypothetical protein